MGRWVSGRWVGLPEDGGSVVGGFNKTPENGGHFRNYQIIHKFQEKDSGYYCWKL